MKRDIPFDCLLAEDLQRLETASREEFLPSPGLAERTCARIWATVDHSSERNVSSITLNRFRMLDEILESSPEPQVPTPISTLVPEPQVPVSVRVSGDLRPGVSEGGWRLVDLIASVAVGILIAVIAFPAINFAKVRTETMLQQSLMKDLSQSIELHALLDGQSEEEEMPPRGINLAASAWREVNQDRLHLLQAVGGSSPAVRSSLDQSQPLFRMVSDRSPHIGEQQGQAIFLGQKTDTAATVGKTHRPLVTDIEKAIPVSNGSLVQPAYGQNVLFHDGRVFFRVLPVFQNSGTTSEP